MYIMNSDRIHLLKSSYFHHFETSSWTGNRTHKLVVRSMLKDKSLYSKGWDVIPTMSIIHVFTVLNQTVFFCLLLWSYEGYTFQLIEACIASLTTTYYWAPGLAVKEAVLVRQIKSGNTKQISLFSVAVPDYSLPFTSPIKYWKEEENSCNLTVKIFDCWLVLFVHLTHNNDNRSHNHIYNSRY